MMTKAGTRALSLLLAIGLLNGCGDDVKKKAKNVDVPHEGLMPPPMPADSLGYDVAPRQAVGTAPSAAEITAFTKKVTAFFKDTGYWDWVWRTSHGLDASYDPDMFHYKLWWQDTGMTKRDGAIIFDHHGTSENITKRTTNVMSNALAGYLLTGDTRMAEVGGELARGVVALSLGLNREIENPLVKYLQSRAVFNHNHDFTVDERKVTVDYTPMYRPSFKWNVHVFEISDNPSFGNIWVANMRSKDDVPYLFNALPMVTRAYYQASDHKVRAAAELYIEYLRGFSQSIVDNDWNILTKYEDGVATISVDATRESNPPADLGSFEIWESLWGPNAECNAQLGAAMTGYGYTAGKGDCDGGKAGWAFELFATGTHYFNYNIYNYFHVAALATANLWGRTDVARGLNEGLAFRFDQLMHNSDMPNTDDIQYSSDLAGLLLSAATHGYPLTAEEAQHIMEWYGASSDWYRQWPHWDPWTSLNENESFTDYKAPRNGPYMNPEGTEIETAYMSLVEMPYIFEYCHSPLKHPDSVPFIDCTIVADKTQWGED